MKCEHDSPGGTPAQHEALKQLYAMVGAPILAYVGCVPCGITRPSDKLKARGIYPVEKKDKR